MSKSQRVVSIDLRSATSRLPEWATEGAVHLEWMERRGVLKEVGKRLRIRREGGYVGLDVVIFLILFFGSRLSVGIKEFGGRSRNYQRQLAALGGRRRLPAPSSVSRVLGAAEHRHARQLAPWLLLDGCGAIEVLGHPSTRTLDARGEQWHVFDLDPTSTVLRHRALPEMDDLPEPRRRSEQAKPGYMGRKRGEVKLSRTTLQHAGSGLWMGLWMGPGNGEQREEFEAAVQTVRDICSRVDHPTERALVRIDGAGGNLPFITACQEAGVRYLTRWNRYGLLDQPEVREYLNSASWYEVPDSGSGPRRHTAELGWMLLPSNHKRRRADGRRYDSVVARMVVSRFAAESKRGTGIFIDGWMYELFVTDLSEEAWPAPELVTAYYGRCGQENRFSQEDHELGLDRIFSYHVPGQELANLVGLFVWNLRVCHGMALCDPPTEMPAPEPRRPILVEQRVELFVEAPSDSDEPSSDGVPAGAPPAGEPGGTPPVAPSEAREQLLSALDVLDWPSLLGDKSSWSWDREGGGLLCPNQAALNLSSVKTFGLDNNRILRFVTPASVCPNCPLRGRCTSSRSTSPTFRKEFSMSVPTDTAKPIGALLVQSRADRMPGPVKSVPPSQRSAPRKMVESWKRPADQDEVGKLAVRSALLLPAALRKALVAACLEVDTHVTVTAPTPLPPPPVAVFAITAADRQHRRKTWTERHQWNELMEGTTVRVGFAGGGSLVCILRLSESTEMTHAAA